MSDTPQPFTYEELQDQVAYLTGQNATLAQEIDQLKSELEVKQARLWAISTSLQVNGNMSGTGKLEEAAKLEAYVRGSHEHLVQKHLEPAGSFVKSS